MLGISVPYKLIGCVLCVFVVTNRSLYELNCELCWWRQVRRETAWFWRSAAAGADETAGFGVKLVGIDE